MKQSIALFTRWKPTQRGRLFVRGDVPKPWARSVAMRRWLWQYRQHPSAQVQRVWMEHVFWR